MYRKCNEVEHPMGGKTHIAKHVSSTSIKLTGLNFKLDLSKLCEMINSKIDPIKEQVRKQRENGEVANCEKGKDSQESENNRE